MAVSSDFGFSWSGTGLGVLASGVYGLCYGGGRFVAAGVGATSLAYSLDCSSGSWSTPIGSDVFAVGRGLSYNAGMWCANCHFIFSIVVCFHFSPVRIACGSGPNTIAYSMDGALTWIGVSNSLAIFSSGVRYCHSFVPVLTRDRQGYASAWGLGRWVAVGSGTYCLAGSTDGINWSGLSQTVFTTGVRGWTLSRRRTLTLLCRAMGSLLGMGDSSQPAKAAIRWCDV